MFHYWLASYIIGVYSEVRATAMSTSFSKPSVKISYPIFDAHIAIGDFVDCACLHVNRYFYDKPFSSNTNYDVANWGQRKALIRITFSSWKQGSTLSQQPSMHTNLPHSRSLFYLMSTFDPNDIIICNHGKSLIAINVTQLNEVDIAVTRYAKTLTFFLTTAGVASGNSPTFWVFYKRKLYKLQLL